MGNESEGARRRLEGRKTESERESEWEKEGETDGSFSAHREDTSQPCRLRAAHSLPQFGFVRRRVWFALLRARALRSEERECAFSQSVSSLFSHIY